MRLVVVREEQPEDHGADRVDRAANNHEVSDVLYDAVVNIVVFEQVVDEVRYLKNSPKWFNCSLIGLNERPRATLPRFVANPRARIPADAFIRLGVKSNAQTA
jgi:hypothetical protein